MHLNYLKQMFKHEACVRFSPISYLSLLLSSYVSSVSWSVALVNLIQTADRLLIYWLATGALTDDLE